MAESTPAVEAHEIQPAGSVRTWLRWLLGAVVAIAILANLGKWLRPSEQLSVEQEILRRLHRIHGAIYTYDHQHNRLPPPSRKDDAGRPIYSWRALILRYMSLKGVSTDLASDWKDSKNRVLADAGKVLFNVDQGEETQFLAVAGAGTAFNVKSLLRMSQLPPNLVLVIATANTKIHWMEPGDHEVESLLSCKGTLGQCVESIRPDGVHVLFTDGEIWCLSNDTPMELFAHFLTIKEARTYSREQSLKKYQLPVEKLPRFGSAK